MNETLGIFTNTGILTVDEYRNVSFTGASFTNQSSAVLKGRGTIDVTNATFTNFGTVNPGLSPGKLNITGDLPQEPGSVINIELAGTVVDSSYDQLNISGVASLDGTLNINLINNFIPVIGDTFEIMTAASHSGAFNTINGLFTGTGVSFDLLTTPTALKLITLDAPNHPPVVANNILDIFLDEDFGSHWVANLDSVFDDSDLPLGDSLIYGFSISNSKLNGSISGSDLFLNSVSDSNGIASLIVTATDIGLSSVSDTFLVTIVPVNDPPLEFLLLEPQNQTNLTSADTIDFLWNRSFDVDNDPIVYDLNLFGTLLDTTFSNIADTTFEFIADSILLPNSTYSWTVSAFDGLVTVASLDTFSFSTPLPTGTDVNLNQLPKVYALKQNYPNPFNPTTTIVFDLPKTSQVSLKIYNILGEEVATLVSDRMAAGTYKFKWGASDLASGVYIYRLETAEYTKTKMMLLMK
jgi:hypothetical protein